jgi:hypothetical protein
MAVAKSRVIYTEGKIEITGVGACVVQTAQNATFTLTVPRENVNAMGFEGTVDRPQLDADDATIEFAFIPQTAVSGGITADMNAVALEALRADTVKGTPSRSEVIASGVGKLGVQHDGNASALLNSIAVDGSVGAMPTTTLGFTGVAAALPAKAATQQASSLTIALVEPQGINLIIADSKLLPNGSCAQSGAVAWDLPVEVVLCLNDNPATDGVAFGNPPGTASFTVESLSDEIPGAQAADNYTLEIGDFTYVLNKARIDSKTNSMAVGDLFATFNYVLGGTADGMAIS